MKRFRSLRSAVALGVGCALFATMLAGCSSSRTAGGAHDDCPMCSLGSYEHGPHGGPSEHYHDPADHIGDYHRQQTARQSWRSKHVPQSRY